MIRVAASWGWLARWLAAGALLSHLLRDVLVGPDPESAFAQASYGRVVHVLRA